MEYKEFRDILIEKGFSEKVFNTLDYEVDYTHYKGLTKSSGLSTIVQWENWRPNTATYKLYFVTGDGSELIGSMRNVSFEEIIDMFVIFDGLYYRGVL